MLNIKEIIVERSSAGLTIAGLIGRPNNGRRPEMAFYGGNKC